MYTICQKMKMSTRLLTRPIDGTKKIVKYRCLPIMAYLDKFKDWIKEHHVI